MVRLVIALAAASTLASLAPSIVVAVPIQTSDELVNRDIPFPAFDHLARDLYTEEDDLIARLESEEGVEVVERSPKPIFALFKLAAKGIGALVNKIKNRKKKRDLGDESLEELELISRAEVDELAHLMARNPEPFLPLLGLGLGLLGGRKRDLFPTDLDEIAERYFDELSFQAREMDDFEDFEMRGYHDENEIALREWMELEELD